jgi:hypothetical protein
MSSESQEYLAALDLAAASLLDHPGDEDAAAEHVSSALGWSRERARWFLSVNAEKLQQLADELRRRRTDQTPCCAGDE